MGDDGERREAGRRHDASRVLEIEVFDLARDNRALPLEETGEHLSFAGATAEIRHAAHRNDRHGVRAFP
jgi:hypothetical protein